MYLLPVFLSIFAAFLSISSWNASFDLSVGARKGLVSCGVSNGVSSQVDLCCSIFAQMSDYMVPVFAFDSESMNDCTCNPSTRTSMWNGAVLEARSTRYLPTSHPVSWRSSVSSFFTDVNDRVSHHITSISSIQCVWSTLIPHRAVVMYPSCGHIFNTGPVSLQSTTHDIVPYNVSNY